MNNFPDSDFGAIDMSPEAAQMMRVAKQLDQVSRELANTQLSLSNLTLRYEFMMTNLEQNKVQLTTSLATVHKDIQILQARIDRVEEVLWKYSGAVLILAFIVPVAINYFSK